MQAVARVMFCDHPCSTEKGPTKKQSAPAGKISVRFWKDSNFAAVEDFMDRIDGYKRIGIGLAEKVHE